MANLKYQSDSDSSGIDGGGHVDEGGSDTDCSGATEGPEEFGSQSEDSIMDDESFLTNQQLQKLHNLPKSLNLVESLQKYEKKIIKGLCYRAGLELRNVTLTWKDIIQDTLLKRYKIYFYQICFRCGPLYRFYMST